MKQKFWDFSQLTKMVTVFAKAFLYHYTQNMAINGEHEFDTHVHMALFTIIMFIHGSQLGIQRRKRDLNRNKLDLINTVWVIVNDNFQPCTATVTSIFYKGFK